ncbi:MAG: 9-O-acetyl-N-acetylneuraminate esterase, partial [Kineothrix sp.]|nr:9-O-acetyl-N-acetylneuraminate esterase [Kineothrix sp.]
MHHMVKSFNITADCKPEIHYMVDIENRLIEIKSLVDAGKYFTINRARQYGKTTTLRALNRFLQNEYYVVLMDFQTFGNAKFRNENAFSIAFANAFLRMLKR